jgi:hypothetical protein
LRHDRHSFECGNYVDAKGEGFDVSDRQKTSHITLVNMREVLEGETAVREAGSAAAWKRSSG